MEKRDHNDSGILVLAEEYIGTLEARRYSPMSLRLYRQALNDFTAHVGKSDVRTVTCRELEAYRTVLMDRKFKPASITVYFQAIRGLFRYLEENQHIFENPAAKLQAMKVPALMQPVPTEEEMRILLDQPDTSTPTGIRDRAFLETVYSAGLRRRELLDLTVGSVNLEEGRVRVMGKGSRERVAPLGKEAVEWLRRYLRDVRPRWAGEEGCEALWLSFRGNPLGYEVLQPILAKYRKAPGITTRIGLHSIRRACATHMLRRGASPMTIQLLLGHTSMTTLQHYLKVTIADLKQAHEKSRVGQ